MARRWRVMGRPGKALQPEVVLQGPGGLRLRVVKREGLTALVEAEVPLWSIMERHGEMPLPPYIDREATVDDRQDYQTLFARERGAVAAPTASLHFTKRVLALLQERRVARAELVLHVGPGTFLPVRPEHADDVRQHVMHSERYEIPEATLEAIAETRKRGGRVVAVGTTVARTLEAWGKGAPAAGTTDIFITPGFEFTQVDALVTNFHLPKSTLLMLVSAFAGLELVREAYRHAIEAKYRFYSYGDAMLIV